MQRNTEPSRETRGRGQTAVIAIVLLVGIVAVGSIGILLLGANATDQSKENAEAERVQNAFIQLEHDVDSVAYSEERATRTNLDLPDDSQGAVRKESSGRIVVKRRNLTTTKTVVVKDIGAIIYEENGVHYAYQSGAAWRGTGNETEMLAPPDLEYETVDGEDPTVTLQISDLNGKDQISSGEVQVRKISTEAPLNDVATIDNQVVTISIQSDYYVGWGTYFEERYDNVLVTYDHANDTVELEFGRLEIEGEWDKGVISSGDVVTSASGCIHSNVTADGNIDEGGNCGGSDGVAGSTDDDYDGYDRLDYALDNIAEDKNTSENRIDLQDWIDTNGSTTTLTSGTYFVGEDVTVDGTDLEFDVSSGNVTLVLDANMTVDGNDVTITGTSGNDNSVRVYQTEDLAIGTGSAAVNTGNNASRLQWYASSESKLSASQAGEISMGYYAPRDSDPTGIPNHAATSHAQIPDCLDQSVCLGIGSFEYNGAIVAGSVNVDQGTDLFYDDSLENVSPVLVSAGVIPPRIQFLHVAVNRVCVGEDRCNRDPEPSFDANESSPEPGETVEFDASPTSDSDGSIVSYEWDFDDGNATSGDFVTHNFSEGTYTVELNVTDDEGASEITTKTIEVAPDTAPTAAFDHSLSGSTVDFDASDSVDDDGTIDEYEWDFGDGTTTTTSDPEVSHTYGSDGDYTVTLTVTDDDDNTSATSETITVGGNPPSATIDSTSKSGSAPWNVDVEYTLDDPDLDLDEATVRVKDAGGNVIASTTYDATGEEGTTNTTSFTGLATEPVTAEVTATDTESNTDTDSTPLGGSGSPTFDSTSVDDQSTGAAKYNVNWQVSDPAGGAEFKNVTVTFDWSSGDDVVSSTVKVDSTGTENFGGSASGDTFTITLELYDQSGSVIECREYTDGADGSSPADGSYSSC